MSTTGHRPAVRDGREAGSESPPPLAGQDDLPEFDDYWLSWPDTIREQTDPGA